MHVKFLFLVLSMLMISCSALDPCQNKDLFIKKHSDFVTETLDSREDYSDEEWTIRDEEFDKLVNECYENIEEDMSKEEKKEYWITNSKYLATRVKKNSSKGIESLTGLIESLSGDGVNFAEGLGDVFGDDLQETFDDFEGDLSEIFDEDFKDKLEEVFDDEVKEDIKKAFGELGEKLNDIGEELKEIVEEEK